MENTDQLQFEDEDGPKWYLAEGEAFLGPSTAQELYAKIIAGEVSWAHFAWKRGMSNWRRICEVEPFSNLVPAEPSKEILKEVRDASKLIEKGLNPKSKSPPPAIKEWFLYFNESQFGPFDHDEVVRLLHTGKINDRVHAWRQGMDHWKRLKELESFKADIKNEEKTNPKFAMTPKSGTKPSIHKSGKPNEKTAEITAGKTSDRGHEKKAGKRSDQRIERRVSPRQPLVARIFASNSARVSSGICRDISVGGMQVLTDHVPGEVGTKLRLNITPSQVKTETFAGQVSKKKSKLTPFVAEGIIIRILEDRRGFSFRFTRLSDDAVKSISEYVKEA